MRKQELHPRTAIINKNQKNQSKKARSDALLWLAANFPKAFDNSVRISPLKKGIMDDILQIADKAAAAGISKSKLREAVVLFTRRLDYLTCLKSREMRIDLQGNTLCEVTEEEAECAAAKIKKRIEKGIRNARKAMTNKATYPASMQSQNHSYNNSKSNSISSSFNKDSTDKDYLPIYPTRSSTYSPQNDPITPKTATTVIKHKTTRQYDPNAVARLKEKLGLSRSIEKKETTTE